MSLKRIEKKVLSGKRITEEDAVFLFKCDDLFTVGELATHVAGRWNGNRVYFIRNRHINPTNLCVNRCRFCAFSRSPGQKGAFAWSVDEILGDVKDVEDVTEFHIVGGLHPEWPFEYYLRLLRRLKKEFPKVRIKAFTAVEIDYLAGISGLGVAETLNRLMDAGLESMPGGGAEILGHRVRRRICPEKITGRRWLSIMKTAHGTGLKTNATMLYGHVERIEDRVDHLRRLRKLQDRTGGFNAFIPLAFQPGNSCLGEGLTHTSALDDLRTIAVSRLYLDNVPHVKAYWVMLGEKMTQLALAFGADDVDGTVVRENIARMAGAKSGQELSSERMVSIIRRAGRIPVERGSLYEVVREYAPTEESP